MFWFIPSRDSIWGKECPIFFTHQLLILQKREGCWKSSLIWYPPPLFANFAKHVKRTELFKVLQLTGRKLSCAPSMKSPIVAALQKKRSRVLSGKFSTVAVSIVGTMWLALWKWRIRLRHVCRSWHFYWKSMLSVVMGTVQHNGTLAGTIMEALCLALLIWIKVTEYVTIGRGTM